MTAFAGHSEESSTKAIYDDPTKVAPADRLYAADNTTDYKPSDYTSQPGASARSGGYPRKS